MGQRNARRGRGTAAVRALVTRLVLVLMLLVVTSASNAHAGDKAKPAGIQRSPEFIAEVNAAIDKGVAWLRTREGADSFAQDDFQNFEGGLPACAIYTLRVCGVSRDEPVVAKGLAKLRTMFYAQRDAGACRTYTVALMCMAAADEPAPPSASKSTTSDAGRSKPSARDVEWLQDMVKWLERAQDSGGGWTYSADGSGYDQSNTQFALLGLRAAVRGGAVVDPSAWVRALKQYLATQETEGPEVLRFVPSAPGETTDAAVVDHARGWGYRKGDGLGRPEASELPYGSMSASGVAAVAICREQLARTPGMASLVASAERSIRDGVAWLGRHFTVMANPGPGRGPGWPTVYYYLYSLERAGMLAPVDWMGDHDWYGEGARALLVVQCAAGAWSLNGERPAPRAWRPDDTLATCCALLFLKRGTVPTARAALTPSSDESPINFAAASGLSDRDFDAFVEQILDRCASARDTKSRQSLYAGAASVGVRILAPLILRLDSPLAARREAAYALLRNITGLDHGYDPGAQRELREVAITRWQSWLLEHSKELRYEATLGRIVAK